MAEKFDLTFRGTNFIKLAFEEVLKEMFSNQSIVKNEKFLYNDKDNETKIKIFRSFPHRIEFYPCILLTAEGFDGSLTAFGPEMEELIEVQEGVVSTLTQQVFHGDLTIPINLKVMARGSSDDREQLTDTLLIILRILGRGAFFPFGFAYNKIQINGEDQIVDDDNTMIFTNSITVPCITDYQFTITPDVNQILEKIVVKVYGKLKEGDPLTPLFAPGP